MLDGSLTETPTPVLKPDSVRVATLDDEDKVFDLLWHGLRYENNMGAECDEPKVRAQIKSLCSRQSGVVGVIEGPDGRFVGTIGIQLTQTWWSKTWFLCELWCYVQPKFRKRSHFGADLFQFARFIQFDLNSTTAQKALGYPLGLELSVYSLNRLKAKERLWSRHARQIGAMFWCVGQVWKAADE